MRTFKSFWQNTSGATSIEYALIASFIFLAIIASVSVVGTKLSSKFGQVSGNLS